MQIDRSENNCFTEKKPIFLGPPNLDVVSLSTMIFLLNSLVVNRGLKENWWRNWSRWRKEEEEEEGQGKERRDAME